MEPRPEKPAQFGRISLAWTVRFADVQPKVRIFRIAAGFGLLLAGTVMLVVPGPGWLTIAAGLTTLAADFPWARRALDAIKTTAIDWHRRLTREGRHGDNTEKAGLASDSERHPGA